MSTLVYRIEAQAPKSLESHHSHQSVIINLERSAKINVFVILEYWCNFDVWIRSLAGTHLTSNLFLRISNFLFILAPADSSSTKLVKKMTSGTPSGQEKASTSKTGREQKIKPPPSNYITLPPSATFLQTTSSDEEESPITGMILKY